MVFEKQMGRRRLPDMIWPNWATGEYMSLIASESRRGIKSRLSSPLGNRRLDLDVVRGVAILLAMGWHLGLTDSGSPVADVVMWPSRAFGWAGVDLFFVLSGFLMGGIVFRERQRTGRFAGGHFLVRRAFKLWPVFYVFLLAQLALGDNEWQTYFFQNFVHLQNYLGSSHAHLWSLAVEEHFYLALALIAPLMFRRGVSDRSILIGLSVAMIVPLILRIIGFMTGSTPVQLQSLTHFRLDGLAAGVLLALVSIAYPDALDRLLRLRLLWLVLTMAVIAFLSFTLKQSALGSTIGYTVTMIGAASFLLLLYKAAWVPRWSLLLRPVGLLGVYSYALYVWHIAAARLAERIVEMALPQLDAPILQTVINYAFAIAVAVVITRLVEWPSLRLRDRLIPRTPH
jgi:peptidoglycan/LPS O-acetylase OafA/YrhL